MNICSSIDLVKIDQYADCLPFVSSVTNLVVLAQKVALDVFKWSYSYSSAGDSSYLAYIEQKEYSRCCLLLIPGIGNIGVYCFFADVAGEKEVV